MKLGTLLIMLLILEIMSPQSQAQTSAHPPAKNAKPEVLDFEADVIEGQKKSLDLFLQLDVEKADLSSVLYDRANFNDYHAVDSKRRPKFSNPKRAAR